MTAVRSLTWSIWQRNHLALKMITAIVAVLCLVLRFFKGEGALVPVLSVLLLFMCYLGLIAIFMYQDSDVGVKGSTYPSHMFALPVRTSQLVLTPLCLGTVVLLGFGFLVSSVLKIEFHYLPTLFMTAIYVMLTAIFWYPFGVPYSKLFLTLVSIPVLIYSIVVALQSEISEATVCKWLVGLIVACMFGAYRGVVKARRGELYVFWWQTVEAKPIAQKPIQWLKFRNAFAAQRWYEWRQQGIILPCLVAFLCVLFLVPIYWNTTNTPLYSMSADSEGKLPMIPTYLWTYTYLLLWLVPVTAWVVGCGARRNEVKNSDRSFYLFFGTRPMSDGALVAQKLWSALRSSVLSWGIVLCCLLLLLPMQGGMWDHNQGMIVNEKMSIYSLLIHFGTPLTAVHFLAGLAVFIGITWRNYAVGFWTEMSGLKWLRFGYPGALLILAFGGPSALNNIRPNTASELEVFTCISIIVWIAIALRVVIATTLVRKHLRAGLMTRQSLRRGVLGYAAAISSVGLIAIWLTIDFRDAFVTGLHVSELWTVWYVVGFVLLWTPIVRILLATEMLHQNRHRAN